jgi:uncharacterized protein involved in outer membrane biogenesis
MSPSTRKKVVIGAGSVIGVLIVALLIAPSFFDLNQYKPQLVSEVKKATGRDLVIDGPVSLSLLPLPEVSVTGVKFFNVAGAKNPNMVEVKSVTVRPSLLALLVGDIQVSEVTLVEPKIVLEINAEGKPNWEFTPSVAEAKPAAPKPASPKPISLGRLVIDNGTLIFSDSKAGVSVVAEKANFSASVGSLDGPYGLEGRATVNGAPLVINLSVGTKGSNGLPASVALEAGGGKLTFKGTLSEIGPNASLAGIASISAESLTGFIATLISLAGQPVPALPPLLASKFSFDGGIEVSQTKVAANDFKLALAGDSGSGSLSVTLKPALVVDGKLLLPKIDLDRALAGLQQPPAPTTAGAKPAATAAAPAAAGGDSMLTSLTAKLSIEANEVIYHKEAIRNVALDLDAKGGAVAVPKLSATLPGDMVLQAKSTMSGDPNRPTVSGEFSLVGPKLRDTLKWLDADVSQIPADKLTRLSLKGRMASSGGNVQVTNAAFELDDVKGTGGVVVTFSVPLSIVTNLEFDTLDLDPFLAKPAGGAKPAAATLPPVPSAKPAAGPSFGLKAKVAKLIYNKEAIGGVEIDIALHGSTLKLNDIKVSNLGGARLAVRGSVANYDSSLPHPDIAFNFEAPDIGRVLKIIGGTAPSDLGMVRASGGIDGTIEAITFKQLNVSAQGQTAQVNGTLTMPGAAKGPPSTIGYKGSVTANGQTIEGTVEAKVADRPSITADLKTSLLDVDKLGTGSPPPTAARGRPATAPAAAPIDTTAMRAFDASVRLVASTLVSSPLHISNADLAITLKDGVLTISHFRGGLYGGGLDLSGVVDGSKPGHLALDFKGNASNIGVGEMLRSMSGSNQFGGAVKVTVDGKLNASGLTVKAAGATSAQVRSSMAGGAQLSGHLFVGADKALTMIGSAAAGAVGGVIDNTLGNVLGAVGQRGGVGVSNLLNAASLVLNRFVNRDNPISGQVDIAGGVLSDRGLLIQGDRATASIATRTNLVASTTDTTVNIMIAEDGSAPYMIATVRGPLSSPSYNVVRGTAKDPPGFMNTLTNAGSQVISPVEKIIPNVPMPSVPLPNIPNPLGGLFGR